MKGMVIWEDDTQTETLRNNGANGPKYCTFCGSELSPPGVFCVNCGGRQPKLELARPRNAVQHDYRSVPVNYQQPVYSGGYAGYQKPSYYTPQNTYMSHTQYPASQPVQYDYYPARRPSSPKRKKSPSFGRVAMTLFAVFSLIGVVGMVLLIPANTIVTSSGVPKYAVVICVSDYIYCDSENGDLPPELTFYAHAWENYLEEHDYEVELLLDHDATKEGIQDAIEDLKEKEEEGDYVAFIYIGHGDHDGYFDYYGNWHYEAGHTYICPADMNGYTSSLIKDTDLAAWFSDFESEHIFMFFESCYSGGLNELAGPGRYVALACGEETPTIIGWSHWFLMKGLETGHYSNCEEVFDEVNDDYYNTVCEYAETNSDWNSGYPTMPVELDGDPNTSFEL